jgi:hypothetical protein
MYSAEVMLFFFQFVKPILSDVLIQVRFAQSVMFSDEIIIFFFQFVKPVLSDILSPANFVRSVMFKSTKPNPSPISGRSKYETTAEQPV